MLLQLCRLFLFLVAEFRDFETWIFQQHTETTTTIFPQYVHTKETVNNVLLSVAYFPLKFTASKVKHMTIGNV